MDLELSDLNCGSCGRACGAGTGTVTCQGGECVTCAQAGLTDCDGTCEDLQWSDGNCGGCGAPCAADQVCVFGQCLSGDGTCTTSCGNDSICCSGDCVNPRTSDWHCGGCGVAVCSGGCTEACRDGVCTPVDCGGGDD